MKANERRGPRAGLRGAATFSKVADEQSALKSMEKARGTGEKPKKVWHQKGPHNVSRRKTQPFMPSAVKRIKERQGKRCDNLIRPQKRLLVSLKKQFQQSSGGEKQVKKKPQKLKVRK